MALGAVMAGAQLGQLRKSMTSRTLPLKECSLGRTRTSSSLLVLQGVGKLSLSLQQWEWWDSNR